MLLYPIAMESKGNCFEIVPDADFFNNVKSTIEKELDKMKKIVNNINQMRGNVASCISMTN